MDINKLIEAKHDFIEVLPELTSGDLLRLLAELNKEINKRYL